MLFSFVATRFGTFMDLPTCIPSFNYIFSRGWDKLTRPGCENTDIYNFLVRQQKRDPRAHSLCLACGCFVQPAFVAVTRPLRDIALTLHSYATRLLTVHRAATLVLASRRRPCSSWMIYKESYETTARFTPSGQETEVGNELTSCNLCALWLATFG